VSFDVSGAQQTAVESRIGQLTQALPQWQEAIKNVDQGTDKFKELDGAINAATQQLDQLKTKLGELQQFNTLKGLFSDIFGAFNRAISTSITGVIQGTTTVKQAFENMGQSIVLTLNEMIIRRGFMAMEQAFFKMLDDMAAKAKESGLWSALIRSIGSIATSAAAPGGDVPSSAQPGDAGTYMQGGGIVTGPTRALIGEHGAEAVIPLSHLPDMMGGARGGPLVEVTIVNQTDSQIEHKETSGADGRRKLEVLIRDSWKKGAATGEFDKVLGQAFGLTRQGTPR
jgi:hypothetical protein